MYAVWIMFGALLILAAVHDLFHTLFHPSESGALSDWIAHGVWKITRAVSRVNQRMLSLAGPFAMLTIVGTWCALIVLGAALLYWPNMSKDIVTAPGIDPAEHLRFSDAVNLSLGSLITFGGDMNSKSHVLRFIMGLEAVLGFGVLTGSISWLLSVYPVLERRCSLAHTVTLLHNAEHELNVHLLDLPPQTTHSALMEFNAAITTLRNDMVQFPVTYYFRATSRQGHLSPVLPYLSELADRAAQPDMPQEVRLAGTMLGGALKDLLNFLGDNFLDAKDSSPQQILEKYLREHRNRPLVPIRPYRWGKLAA